MAFNTRIYGYRGITQVPLVLPKQAANDSVQIMVEPYEWGEVVATTGVAASSPARSDTQTVMVRIEVPDAQTIRYEINPPGRAVAASAASPSLSGKDYFYFGAGWTVSVIDATGLA